MTFTTRIKLAVLLFTVATTATVAMHGAATARGTRPSPVGPAARCPQLVSFVLPDTTIVSATVVPAGTFTPPGSAALTDLPAFCRVVAKVPPQINYEVWLPLTGWQGRFQGVGNGGTAGTLSYSAMATALKGGYATASTDTGHLSTDTTWFTNQQQLVDHGYRALHLMTVGAKAITSALYHQPLRAAYFNGCSTGGGQAFMEAQRFPDDYDGIVAGDPNYRRTRQPVTNAYSWVVTHRDPAANLPPDKVAAIAAAVLAQGDAIDGVTDGVIENPLHVKLDVQRVIADAGLSPAQAGALEDLYQGPRNPRTGEQLFPGYLPGTEAGWNAVVGPQPFVAASSILRFAIYQDPNYNLLNFDFDSGVALLDDKLSSWAAESPDLRAFVRHGGKLLVYHGWSDWGITPQSTLDYYHKLQAFFADHGRGLPKVDRFFRMFFVPGMGHCSGGAGTDHFDMMPPLVNWVERHDPPVRVPAAHVTSGVVDRTRPLCVYPSQAVYLGRGSTDDERNFRCEVVSG